MDVDSPADGVGEGLGETEEADLPLGHQFRHGPHRLLDGDVGIGTVLVVEVDVVGTETAERGLAGVLDVGGVSPDGAVGGIAPPHDAEFGGYHHLVPSSGNGPTHQLLVAVGAVHVGGVQEVHSEVEGPMNGGDRLGVVTVAVELTHAHASEPFGRDGEPLGTECAWGAAHRIDPTWSLPRSVLSTPATWSSSSEPTCSSRVWASSGSPGPKLAAGTPCAQNDATSVQPCLAVGCSPVALTRAGQQRVVEGRRRPGRQLHQLPTVAGFEMGTQQLPKTGLRLRRATGRGRTGG